MTTPEPTDSSISRRPLPQYGEYAPPGYVSPAYVAKPALTATAVAPIATPRDAWLTLLLLALGSGVSAMVIVGALDFEGLMQTYYTTYGIGTYVAPQGIVAAPIALVVSHVVALVSAVTVSRRQIRHGRRSFWVPLVAGAAAAIAYFSIMFTVIFTDDRLLAALTAASQAQLP